MVNNFQTLQNQGYRYDKNLTDKKRSDIAVNWIFQDQTAENPKLCDVAS